MYDEKNEMLNKVAAAGSMMATTTKKNLENQISNLEQRLADLKELKEILESEPKLNRALDIMRHGGIY